MAMTVQAPGDPGMLDSAVTKPPLVLVAMVRQSVRSRETWKW
jgi:hypothetical protein